MIFSVASKIFTESSSSHSSVMIGSSVITSQVKVEVELESSTCSSLLSQVIVGGGGDFNLDLNGSIHPGLRASLFSHVPPYINFSSSEQKGEAINFYNFFISIKHILFIKQLHTKITVSYIKLLLEITPPTWALA